MATSLVSSTFSSLPQDKFRYYRGPSTRRRRPTRRSAQAPPPLESPLEDSFTDIDEILYPRAPEPVLLGLQGDEQKGSSQDDPITIEDGDSGSDTDPETDSEPLPLTDDESALERVIKISYAEAGDLPVDEGATGPSAPSGSLEWASGEDGADGHARLFPQSAGGECRDAVAPSVREESTGSVAAVSPDGGEEADLSLSSVPDDRGSGSSGLMGELHPSDHPEKSGDSKRTAGNQLPPSSPPPSLRRKRSSSPSSDISRERPGTPIASADPARNASAKRRRVFFRIGEDLLPARSESSKGIGSLPQSVEAGERPDALPEASSRVAPGESDTTGTENRADLVGHADTADEEMPEPLVRDPQPTRSSLPSSAARPHGEESSEQGQILDHHRRGRAIEDERRRRSPFPSVPRPNRATSPTDTLAASPSLQTGSKLGEVRKRDSGSPSPTEAILAPPSYNLPVSPLARGAQLLRGSNQGGSIQVYSPEIKEISLRPSSIGVSFIAATLETTGNPLEGSDRDPAELIERALRGVSWPMGKVENVVFKPLARRNHYEVSGFLRPRTRDASPEPTAARALVPGHDIQTADYRERARALYHHAAATGVDAVGTQMPTDIEELSVRNRSRRPRGANCGRGDRGDGAEIDEDEDEDECNSSDEDFEVPMAGPRNRRWQPEEEEKLSRWRKDGKPWQWIFGRFPHRTEAAIRLRYHQLQRFAQDTG